MHAAVVLLPIAHRPSSPPFLLGAATTCNIVFTVALFAAVAVWLAQDSGESLEERVVETELVERHTEMAEQVLPWAIALTIVAGAMVAADRAPNRTPTLATAINVTLLIAAATAPPAATWNIMAVGHSGARATWNDTPATDED